MKKAVFFKRAFSNFILLIFTVLVFLGGIELILRTGILDCLDCEAPIWIPRKFKEADKKINSDLEFFASQNPYGFTDVKHEFTRVPGTIRIAVLGDSFVWGDGLKLGEGWAHQLQSRIVQKYPDVEVLLWGKQGWSTKDQLEFLEKEGRKFDIDYLIIGYVDNDPDMGDIKQKTLKWDQEGWFKDISKIFPHAADFIAAYVNNAIERFRPSFRYNNWVGSLYSDDNLKTYERLLFDLAVFLSEKKWRALIVTTPNYPVPIFKERYQKVIPLWERAGLPYLNLYPFFHEKFKGTSPRKMYANPANGHPNSEASRFYAEEVLKYLEKKGRPN